LRQLVLICAGSLLLAATGCAPAHIPDPSAESLPSSRGKNPVVAAARSLSGVRYKWGGDSPRDGFDCSGLTWWAYRQVGVELPRISWDQYESGVPVGRRDVQPGDLVFYRLPGDKKSLHVGIATERGTFIHSPRTGGRVREEPMDAPYWQQHYMGARRYLRVGG
jgi:Cell wall-associated hydrolases (invasion-associated proteins)